MRKGLAKGIDPDTAVTELERIEQIFGCLTPENILKASVPEDSVFHVLFDWNDETAAHQYRLAQARTILNNVEIKIISDGGERVIPVYEVVTRQDGRVYKHIECFTPDDVLQVKSGVVKALNYWKDKLSVYKEFDNVIKKIEEIVEEIK